MSDQLRVLLAEDQYLTREGTRRLLEDRGIAVIGTASDYDTVVAGARQLKPDVVLMDVKMPPSFSMEGIAWHSTAPAEPPDERLSSPRNGVHAVPRGAEPPSRGRRPTPRLWPARTRRIFATAHCPGERRLSI